VHVLLICLYILCSVPLAPACVRGRAGQRRRPTRHHDTEALVWRAGLPEPAPGPVPRIITYQRKRANRRIVNEAGFIRLLREFGEARRARAVWHPESVLSVLEAGTSGGGRTPHRWVCMQCSRRSMRLQSLNVVMSAPAAGLQHHSQAVRKLGRRFRRGARKQPRRRQVRVVEFDEGTPFTEQLRAMAATGVLVSVHTSNLANAQFLPPGRAVIELIQRNWVWHNLDRSFQARACSALPVRSALAYTTPESGRGCSASGSPSANSVQPLPATGAPYDHSARLGHRQHRWMPCARPMASGAPGAVPPGPWSVLLWAHGRPRPMSHPMPRARRCRQT